MSSLEVMAALRVPTEGEMTVDVVFEGIDDFEWPSTWSWTGTIGY